MNFQNDLLQLMRDYTDGRITEARREDVLIADFGLNSFELFDLICLVEEKYGLIIPDRILPTLVTVGDLLDYLEKEVKHQ